MTTAESITYTQIRRLLAAAAEAGDCAQVMICQRAQQVAPPDPDDYTLPESASERDRIARMTQEAARAECARVIAEGEGEAARDERTADEYEY